MAETSKKLTKLGTPGFRVGTATLSEGKLLKANLRFGDLGG